MAPSTQSAVSELNPYATAPTPTMMRTIVNARPAVESGCTSPNPIVATVITVM